MTVCEGEGVRAIITMNVSSVNSESQGGKYDHVNVQGYEYVLVRVRVYVCEHRRVPKLSGMLRNPPEVSFLPKSQHVSSYTQAP